jgi:probable F420-dependent oxidoreductase
MRVDTFLGSIEQAAATAREAEAAGYVGAFTGEVSADPFLPLVAASAVTEHLQLGTSIAVAFARSPMTVAYTANDLQRATRGRFVLGIGSQVRAHITRRFAMPWGRPAEQMRDYVLALRAIWRSWSSGEPLEFDSAHYRHTLMTPMFVPPPHEFGPPPVLVAGVGASMTRVAGEVADGFVCHTFSTPQWIRERTLPALLDGRRAAGLRSPDQQGLDGFTVKASVFLATGTDEQIEAAVGRIRPQLAFYASTPTYRPVLEMHGWGDLGTELTRLSKAGEWQTMTALIDDDVLDVLAVVAPVDKIGAIVAERYGGLVDRISFWPNALPADALTALSTNSINGRLRAWT